MIGDNDVVDPMPDTIVALTPVDVEDGLCDIDIVVVVVGNVVVVSDPDDVVSG